jgi:segregation and condensation protein A
MIEKPVPWWRKALNYALSGIRSGFGLFPKPAKPASLEASSLQEDRFLNSPEPTVEVEEVLIEVEEALTDRPANPETVVSVAELAIEPVPAAVAEITAAPDPPSASDDEIVSQSASQPAEAAEPVAEKVIVTEPDPVAEAIEIEEPPPAIDEDPVSTVREVESIPVQPVFSDPAEPDQELAAEPVPELAAEETSMPEPPIELADQIEEPAEEPSEPGEPAVEPVPEPEVVVEPFAELEAEPEPEAEALPPTASDQPAEAAPPAEPESPAKPNEVTEPPPEPISPPIVEPVAEGASIPEPIAQQAVAEPAPVAESAPAIVAVPEPAPPAPSAVEPAAQPPAQPAPDPIADEKAAAKLIARQKKLDDAAELSPFSVIVGQVYTGPLDLLLDLIRQQDIDIYDIPIAKITAQFLAYVNQLKATDVDVAGEFIYTASLLIHIKSKMLLPRSPAGPDETPEDPRRELVERLLEHERFKNAAQMLQQKQMLEAATWTNPGFREFQDDDAAEPEIAADTVDLVRIFRDILERARNRPVIDVQEDSVTVGQMIQFLARRLTLEDKPIALRRLLSHTRSERALVAMFLALLELVRLQAVLLRQDRAFSDIFIKKHTGFDAVMNQGLTNALDDWR